MEEYIIMIKKNRKHDGRFFSLLCSGLKKTNRTLQLVSINIRLFAILLLIWQCGYGDEEPHSSLELFFFSIPPLAHQRLILNAFLIEHSAVPTSIAIHYWVKSCDWGLRTAWGMTSNSFNSSSLQCGLSYQNNILFADYSDFIFHLNQEIVKWDGNWFRSFHRCVDKFVFSNNFFYYINRRSLSGTFHSKLAKFCTSNKRNRQQFWYSIPESFSR